MTTRTKRRSSPGLELLEGRLAPSGGLGGHPAGHHGTVAVAQHHRAGEDKAQHHAAEDNHAAAKHQANEAHAKAAGRHGRDDGPAHR